MGSAERRFCSRAITADREIRRQHGERRCDDKVVMAAGRL
jgi:hypothetical protein